MPTLDWIGKKAVVEHHKQVPFHLLKNNDAMSVGEPGSGNLLVQGDNLVALKALLPYYAGQVKCIYIDPPYNTGNEKWIYNDNVNSPEMREWLGKTVGKEAEDLSRHDKWLCMMYPRLVLLKKFLHSEGSIWISIDDSEVSSLRNLMDEIFGRQKFIACNVWQKRYSRENREAIGDVHEYIIVYAMNPKRFKETRNLTPISVKQAKVYKNPNNDPHGRWRPIPMTAQAGHATPEQFYQITAPSGKVFRPSKGRCWGLAQHTFENLLKQDRIWFGKKGNSQPNVIRYLSEVEGMVPWTWWPHEDVGHTDEAKKEINAILEKDIDFETPKPIRLMEQIIQIASNPGDIIIDSFAGSGTTAHSIMKLNHTMLDKQPRHFILVEMEPDIARDVTLIRMKRAASGYTNAKGEQIESLGGGFRFCELGDPLFNSEGHIGTTVTFRDLAHHVFFIATGEPLPGSADLKTSLLGVSNSVAVYLLYNGIMGDKSVNGGNVLTREILALLPPHEGTRIIYGNGCRISPERLRRENIIFRQVPYEVRVS
jgi:DNA modification methylase